jgi:hypothetical protein
MRDRRRTTIEDLRLAVDCLPRATKVAMLLGIDNNPIIVGAYALDGGICPMLAAHRAGGRTDFIQFAKAWDQFAMRETRRKRARGATERELRVLRAHLEASLLEELGPESDLAAAVSEHRRLVAEREQAQVRKAAAEDEQQHLHERARRFEQRQAGRRSRREHPRVRPGDRDRSRELQGRDGWAWTRVVRHYDEYERVLERLDSQRELLPEPPRELISS